jgi:hypothetical protein
LRIVIGLAALGMLAACGGAEQGEAQAPAASSEVTVVLPPPAPPVDEAETVTRGAARSPGGGTVTGSQAAWAGVLRRVGFPCERVTSVREAGAGYRVECSGGGPYRASRRDGRIKFSKWREA